MDREKYIKQVHPIEMQIQFRHIFTYIYVYGYICKFVQKLTKISDVKERSGEVKGFSK